ncbi:alpha/beta fold hydrolase [Pseudooceanicola algae]|uniref:Aminoacrylate hydrolase RutD n=1 Tax=Pseudooceanicola algae TaxID=1537215 RepID=A0A418SFJ5_9RHOB|nr:alpha/beta fold hydrolase [Pseudooceanicola algae]QPM89873.1 Putative aminoacrylate hydrolase RutD [Pseudooceanicola algae]
MSTTLLLAALTILLLVLGGLVLNSFLWKHRVEALVPPRGVFTRISTGRLHYVVKGPAEAPQVLLIHGLGGQLGNFDCGLIDDLARDHRVIAPDRPGMGYSDRRSSAGSTPADHARYMLELIEDLGLKRPLVIGHSLGGAIAQEIALQAPKRICGLALISPLTQPGQPPSPAFSNLALHSDIGRWIVGWTLAVPTSLRRTPQILDAVYGPEAMPENAPIQGGAMLGLRPAHFVFTSKDFSASTKGLSGRAGRLAELALPQHVLFGRDDRILDPSLHGHQLATQLPDLHLRLVPGGHMLPVTQPQLCADFIREALARMNGPVAD